MTDDYSGWLENCPNCKGTGVTKEGDETFLCLTCQGHGYIPHACEPDEYER